MKKMKKIILFLLAAALYVTVLSASSGEEKVNDFFGYNTWYHREGNGNYEGHSSFNNGKYQVLTMCYERDPSYYLRVDDELIYMPFTFYISKNGNSFYRVHAGQGKPYTYSWYELDITTDAERIVLGGSADADVISKVTVKRTSSKLTLSYRLRKFNHEADENSRQQRVGQGWVVYATDDFVNEDRDFLNYAIAVNMYEYRFKDLGKDKTRSVENTKQLISHFDAPELRILRNLLFAMHGYSFKSADLNRLFNRFDWYKPEISDSSQIEFSQAEQEILDYIIELENAK